jgi:hypothetical protein
MYSSGGGFGQDRTYQYRFYKQLRREPDRFAVTQNVSINNAYAVCMPDSVKFADRNGRFLNQYSWFVSSIKKSYRNSGLAASITAV